MRQLSTAKLAAAVALAFASAAQAAVLPTFQGVPTLRATTATPSTSTSLTGTTTTTPTSTAPVNVTTVDVRAQQTAAATAVTHASGSTSAIESLLGSSSANSATATATTGVGTSGGTSTFATRGTSGIPFAVIGNPSDVTGGAVMTNASGMYAGSPIYGASDVIAGASMLDTNFVTGPATQGNGGSVDRAIREVSKERRRIGRNGQLLNTIAPRTNVDRSHEMRDDPLPYSLTGSNSTLTH